MDDKTLAEELVQRLNSLISEEGVRRSVGQLLQIGVKASQECIKHPTIQCSIMQEATYVVECVRFLGLLNGVIGRSSERTGYIAAEFEQDEGKNLTRLVRFYVTGDKTYVIDK